MIFQYINKLLSNYRHSGLLKLGNVKQDKQNRVQFYGETINNYS